MKYKIYSVLLALVLMGWQEMGAQDIIHGTNANELITSGAPARNYFDSGGAGCDGTGGEYSNSENSTTTFCPSVPGSFITIEFLDVDIETRNSPVCWDFLNIHDGNSTGSPLLFSGCGEEGFDVCAFGFPGDGGDGGGVEGGPNDINASASMIPANANNIFTSTDGTGCLTVNFTTDTSVQEGGWTALVSASGGPVPTLGQWGLIILSLLILTFGMVALRSRQTVLAGAGSSSLPTGIRQLPFNKATFGKMLIAVMIGLAAVFTVAISMFGYEMTEADVPGSLVAGPMLAYLLHLILPERK